MVENALPPSVTTSVGTLSGRRVDGAYAFLGVPYAAVPFGANRMQPPRPVEPWDGARDATSFGPTAPKGDYPPQYQPLFPEVVIPGEEVLNLNVWTPELGRAGLPVMVWIHGGSFMNGSNSVAEYDGSAFARDGVVFVSVNYRLAAEGFLYVEDGIPNLGLLDQIAALQWVHENIAVFGGDPSRVTVAGESAGAMSVTTLMSMPRAAGLFSRAITQSGAHAHTITPEQGLMVSSMLAESLGVAPTREALSGVPLPRLVRAASDLVVEVQTAADPEKWGSLALTLLPFAPVVDGEVLPEHPLTAISSGSSRSIPLLAGWNRDEARLFLVAAQTLELIDDATLGAAAAGYGLGPEGVESYRQTRPGACPGDLLAAVVGDWTFAMPPIRLAEARLGAGGEPTWLYRFDYPDPAANDGLGACHGVELPFVFDTLHCATVRPRVGATPSQQVADTAHGRWVRYVTDGDPGWAPYDTERRVVGLLSDEVREAPDPARLDRLAWPNAVAPA